MRKICCFLMILFATSCIPIRIAPNIKDHKITKANRFKRKLPKEYGFVFNDPKEANEFYNYINTKFQLNHQSVNWDVPFLINNTYYYLRFYETEIQDKTLNLIPFIVDLKRQSNGNDQLLQDFHVSRKGNWYIVLTVNNDESTDCLNPDFKYRKEVVAYLKNLRKEYISTQNYAEVLLEKKSPN